MLLNIADLTPRCCVNTEKTSGTRGLYLQFRDDLVHATKVGGPVKLYVGCDGRALHMFGHSYTLYLSVLHCRNISRSIRSCILTAKVQDCRQLRPLGAKLCYLDGRCVVVHLGSDISRPREVGKFRLNPANQIRMLVPAKRSQD